MILSTHSLLLKYTMRLYSLSGKLINKNVSKYKIDWDKKSRSIPQWKTKKFFQPYWNSMIVYEEFPCFGSLLKLDLYNATLKIGVEIHGPQHYQYHFYHGGSRLNYAKGMINDAKKEEWCRKNGIILIELKDSEVDKLTPDFLKEQFNLIV